MILSHLPVSLEDALSFLLLLADEGLAAQFCPSLVGSPILTCFGEGRLGLFCIQAQVGTALERLSF